MPIQLNNKNGTEVYHRSMEKSNKFSIFGTNKNMNYGYVSISDVERNNKGFYIEIEPRGPAYYGKGLIRLENKKPIDAPVWTLYQQVEEDETVAESITSANINSYKMDRNSSKTFIWPYGGNSVVLTGDFDDWKGTVTMVPVNDSNIYDTVFKAKVGNLDFSRDMRYKFIVDGRWCFDIKKDHVKDEFGNINNILYAQK